MATRMKGQTKTPFIYDFCDWETFYTEVMEYHAATRRNERRVIDFIRTFRQFMSQEVVDHLSTLVNLHPRFETTSGWDGWVNAVVTLLHEHDDTVGRFYDAETLNPGLNTNCRAASPYSDWYAVLRNWRELDYCVSEGTITSQEQRKRFWSQTTTQSRAVLADACEYFDPDNQIWSYGKERELKWAEQVLCYAISSISAHITISRHRQARLWRRWFLAFMFLAVSSSLMALAARAAPASLSSSTAAPLLFGGLMLALALFTGAKYSALNKEGVEDLASHSDRTAAKC